MSNFLRKTVLFGSFNVRTRIPGFLQNPDFYPLRIRWLSTSSNPESFTVSYLINSLGFSPNAALSASKRVNLKKSEKPDKVIKVFKDYGFTQTQISRVVGINPRLLSYDAEKIILPKLEFLKSKGLFSDPEMTKKLSVSTIFQHSLAKQIIPAHDFFRNLFKSDENFAVAFKRFPDIVAKNLEKRVVLNINILREYGVPDSNIATLFRRQPKGFTMISSDRLRKIVEQVEEMGFNDPSRVNFVVAMEAVQTISKSVWVSKVDAFKKWGWSEDDVLNAFQRNPRFMSTSVDKIMMAMDFFTNEMRWSPCLIAKNPILLTMSLKKRLIPRSAVFQVLLLKGLVTKEVSPSALFGTPEKGFMQKFVVPYKEEAPDLLKLYKENLSIGHRPQLIKYEKHVARSER